MRSIFENGGIIGERQNYNSTIQFVGQLSTTFEGSTTVGATINLTSLNLRTGDIVIVAYESCGTVNKTLSIADYTTIADLFADDTEDSNLIVAYKFMGITPDTQVVIPPTQNTADGGAVVLHAYRNVDDTTPLDVAATTASIINTATPNPPAITPVSTGSLIVVAAGAAHTLGTTATFFAPYLSNFLSVAGNDTNDPTVGIGNIPWTGGTFDPPSWRFNGVDSTNFSTNSVTIALRPKRNKIWNITAEKNAKTKFLKAGQATYNIPGSFTFVVPQNVTSISGVCVGGGGGGGAIGSATDEAGAGGGGGALAYATFAVTPGESLTITVGAGGTAGQANSASGLAGGASSIKRGITSLVEAGGGAGGQGGQTNRTNPVGGNGGTVLTGTGGAGGKGGNALENTTNSRGGGGGAGGYSGAGGAGGNNAATGAASTGGGGGGGGGTAAVISGGGGGVGILGAGANGAGGSAATNATGGSGGGAGSYVGGAFGGGGPGAASTADRRNAGTQGAVRIVWGPYSYPSSASNVIERNSNLGIIFPDYVKGN
jgi:hypothetical protein